MPKAKRSKTKSQPSKAVKTHQAKINKLQLKVNRLKLKFKELKKQQKRLGHHKYSDILVKSNAELAQYNKPNSEFDVYQIFYDWMEYIGQMD